MMNRKSYKKLGGAEWFSLFLQSRLFLAEDHLLIQKSSTFNHVYQRFYLKDIQSVYMVATRGRMFWTFFWAIQCVTAGLALVLGNYPIQMAAWLGVSILGLVLVLVRGPSCRAFLETATQTVKLPGLRRQPKAMEVFEQLKHAIEGAQGAFSEVDVANAPGVPEARRVTQPQFSRPTLWHILHFTLWLVNALLLGYAYLKGRSAMIVALYIILGVMSFGTAIVAMVGAIRKRQKTDPLAWGTYAGFGLVVVRGLVVYIFIVFLAAFEQKTGTDELMRFALQGEFLENKNYQVWLDIEVVLSLFMGVIGLLLCVSNSGGQRPGGNP